MLITEDGSGRADAESLCSVSEADAWHFARGRDATWNDRDEEAKEQALRRATDYMGRYRWKGSRVTAAQALDWPRTGAWAYGFEIASNGVPATVRNACAELAFRALDAELLPDIVDSRPVTSEKVGPLEVTYADGAAVQSPVFAAVDAMLKPYVVSSFGVLRLERA